MISCILFALKNPSWFWNCV